MHYNAKHNNDLLQMQMLMPLFATTNF